MTWSGADAGTNLSKVVIPLLRGVAYQEDDPRAWQELLQLQARVRDFIAVLNLELILDESEGYAYLRQRPATEDGPELPRLVRRHQLSFPVSLLLVQLRKRLAEFDARSGDVRLILTRDEIVDMMRVFLPGSANEARLADRVGTQLNKVVELGFVRKLRGAEDQFEVRRILKAFVDAQWLQQFDTRLAQYREHANAAESEAE